MPQCYCGKEALYHHDNSVIYGGRVYGDRGVYYCPDYNKSCDGWVGTHPNGEPLGRLKDKAGRELAKKAHSLFDTLWRGTNKRRLMYQWLQKQMNLTEKECHFALMTNEQLKKAITILERNADAKR